MPYVIESFEQLTLTREEAEHLQHNGLLVQSEENEDEYETTAFIWDDLNLVGVNALNFLEAALKGFRR